MGCIGVLEDDCLVWGWSSDWEGAFAQGVVVTLVLHCNACLDIKEALNQVSPGFLVERCFE